MELRTVRPVLGADDLTFIIDGLEQVRSGLGDQAVALAKGAEYEASGETLALGAEVDSLVHRLTGLRTSIFDAMVQESVQNAQDAVDVAALEHDPAETDEVGTIPAFNEEGERHPSEERTDTDDDPVDGDGEDDPSVDHEQYADGPA